MLNYGLANERGLSKRDIKKLEALHEAMNVLLYTYNTEAEWYIHNKTECKNLRQTVRHLEYQMQTLWGFEEDKSKHTHWQRFTCLNKNFRRRGING